MTAAPPRRLRIAARCRPPRLPCPHRIACSTARCRRLCLADRGRTPPSPPAPSRSTTPHQRRLTLHCTSTSPGGCSSRPFPLIRQRRRSGASPTAAAAARTRYARSIIHLQASTCQLDSLSFWFDSQQGKSKQAGIGQSSIQAVC
ncbi:uncharacterized protein LOC120702383 isoform X3 [Panicum virgatum]|uniref:uncharacterized protein LOC120702383 isoform X3 n=1 Tax=Panicum virgatum TaxID=38727 RepID=UPI0019D68698|nr:uncharacterized protein LOC120702383 isoform X3 [Panicum virgatum]